MSRFTPLPSRLDGLALLERRVMADERGGLQRMFCRDDLAGAGWRGDVVQSNLTLTRRKGTLRGLHFQHPPHAEIKAIACIRGAVFDVAVDIRRGSKTFLEWEGHVLSHDNARTFVLPQGFAHGFQALTDDAEMLYFHSAAHSPEHEGGLNALDPAIAIAWPEPVSLMSERDRALPGIAGFEGVET
ncbi:MAG: dTDP-4-dehydrorhamnose 3,5-epimerase family protein [Rhodobacteraceae bacterium]|nr:dTDP-4-dehydrorhamnose 3,5-epimerase family protein [Paracoccaceae bacterium]